MTAIIWGASGQDGFYLTELLKEKGIDVIGISRSIKSTLVDLTNFEEVRDVIEKHQPSFIFHFAANSTTQHSAWRENNAIISTGSIHILEAVKECAPMCKVFLSGSGLQFVNEGRPIKETDAFEASSIYSVCRIHTVFAARYYRTLGLKVYIGYFFHHDSPLRSERHLNKKIIIAAKRIAAGSNEILEVGDISVKKEFGFAGDIVRGVWELVNQEKIFEATIGTGIAYSIEQWIDICFTTCGLRWQEHILKVEGFIPDFNILVSDPATIFSIGWHPKVSLDDLAKMMLQS